MAALEDEGYIAQPHTSAGRIPTDKGYRMFVDQISEVKPLSGPERRAITELLGGAVGLLAHPTRPVAVVPYPSLRRSALPHAQPVRPTARTGDVAATVGSDAGGESL